GGFGVTDSEGQGSGGGTLVDGLIGDVGNSRWLIAVSDVADGYVIHQEAIKDDVWTGTGRANIHALCRAAVAGSDAGFGRGRLCAVGGDEKFHRTVGTGPLGPFHPDVIGGVRRDGGRAVGVHRAVAELDPVVVAINDGGRTIVGIVPVNDGVVIGPGIPANAEVKIEARGERECAIDVLRSHAVHRL